MKKATWFLVLVLLSGILSGCNTGILAERTPYLNERERSEIESGILNGLEFRSSGSNLRVSFRNTSEYTLQDLYFIRKGFSDVILILPYVEAGMEVNMLVGTPQKLGSQGEMYLTYTIGEYTYYSKQTVPIVLMKEDQVSNKSSFTIYTDSGPVQTDFSEPLEFMSGTELEGLTHTKIHSIAMDTYGFSLELRGQKPDNYYNNAIYKLFDADDVIVDCGSLHFFDGEDLIYLPTDLTGEYTLVFEEEE